MFFLHSATWMISLFPTNIWSLPLKKWAFCIFQGWEFSDFLSQLKTNTKLYVLPDTQGLKVTSRCHLLCFSRGSCNLPLGLAGTELPLLSIYTYVGLGIMHLGSLAGRAESNTSPTFLVNIVGWYLSTCSVWSTSLVLRTLFLNILRNLSS